MNKILVLTILLPIFISALSVEDSFSSWVRLHDKRYSHNNEYQYRLTVYRQNLEFIEEHNRKNLGYVVAMNHFGDLTLEEFKELYLSTKVNESQIKTKRVENINDTPLADDVDWRKKGAVTEVKDQGQCGSCWAFSSTGSIEGAYYLATGKLIPSSEQQLVDCSRNYGNEGCNGGLMDNSFDYIIKSSKGLVGEEDYPYTARDGNCKFDTMKNKIKTTISDYRDVFQDDEKALQQVIMKQPISVAIDAGHSSFQFYKSGVYYEPNCSPAQLNHGVLAVGYGTSTGDYYIVKNSWGTKWGAQGYILMARNKDNHCGIATMASYPIVNNRTNTVQ